MVSGNRDRVELAARGSIGLSRGPQGREATILVSKLCPFPTNSEHSSGPGMTKH